MQPKIIELRPMTIVGVGGEFISNMLPDTNASRVIPAFWDGFIHRRHELATIPSDATYGVITGCELTSLRYVAGAEVEASAALPDGMEAVDIPGGRYAVFTHHGPIWELAKTTHNVYREWMPQSGLAVRDAPHLEVYDSRFNPSAPHSELDILVPVE